MSAKNDKTSYVDLLNSTDVPMSDEEFSLEDILSEYGGSMEQSILRDAEAAAESPAPEEPESTDEPDADVDTISFPVIKTPVQKAAPAEELKESSAPETVRLREETQSRLLAQAVELPESDSISMEDLVSNTVDSVMDEHQEPLLPPRRRLFSRRLIEDTETLFEQLSIPRPKPKAPKPEPAPAESAEHFKHQWRSQGTSLPLALLLALLPAVLSLLENAGVVIPLWTGNIQPQAMILLAILMADVFLCRHVFFHAVRTLKRHRFTSECLVSLSVIVAVMDCLYALFPSHRDPMTPYAAVTALTLVSAQWGLRRESRALYDTFRTAALDDDPPYLVASGDDGACKQPGSLPGFTNTTLSGNISSRFQTILLPFVAVATLVFATLSSHGRSHDFLLHWSILLCTASTLALPLCWPLPFSRLTRHLRNTGCAIAGWKGAAAISRRQTMILGDNDLFPPGTLSFNGMKVYGEKLPKAAAYAAAMTKAADCGLERLFEQLRRSEDGPEETVDDFGFCEEGGYSATIHGETVLLGTDTFMHSMHIRLPADIDLKTGIFLAVDQQLIAVFAVKYNASENVDYALRILSRGHITPLLASRDPNITPALLKRKFTKKLKMVYPSVDQRVALSEAVLNPDTPRALLFREGLLPYAEVVAGSHRLCKAVRRATFLSLAGSAIGTVLMFYLLSLGTYTMLNPLSLDIFLLLWALPVFLFSDWTGRY